MILTANYGLRVWEGSDTFNTSDLEYNWNLIDDLLAEPSVALSSQILAALPGSPTDGELVTLTSADGSFVAGQLVKYSSTASAWHAVGIERRSSLPVSNLYDGRIVYLTADNGGFLVGDIVRYHTQAVAGWRRLGSVGKAVGHTIAATSISNLNTAAGGTPFDGQNGKIRVGSSPYWFIHLTYDSTYSKWVSDAEILARVPAAFDTTFGGTDSYTLVTGALGQMPAFKALWDAGLRPQFCLDVALSTDSTGGTVGASFAISEYNDGDTYNGLPSNYILDYLDANGVILSGSTNGAVSSSGWLAPSITTPTKNRAIALIGGKHTNVSFAGNVLPGTQLMLRWVSS